MPKITWDESYSVGNPDLDAQHQRWIEIINELHEALMGSALGKKGYSGFVALQEMTLYVKLHFVDEEAFMQSIQYPDFLEHKKVHDTFIVTLDKYLADMTSGRLVLNREIMRILNDWLITHIMNLDKKYAVFAAEHRKR